MTVAVYWPCFLAALCVIVIYFTAKTLFDSRNIGLLSAFLLAIAPGQFLARSIIGFNDHHVAEVLFSTIVMFFIIKMLISVKGKDLKVEDIKNKNFAHLKTTFLYAVLTGFALSLYTLVWEGALLFAFAIGVYVSVQMIVNHLNGKSNVLIALLGIIIFLIDFLIVLVTPQIGEYKSLHMFALVFGMIAFFAMCLISEFLQKKNTNKWAYPGLLIGAGILFLVAGSLISEQVYTLLISVLGFFVRTGGATTIGEVAPFFGTLNPFVMLTKLFQTFSIMGILWPISLVIIAYYAFKENRKEEILFVIWSLVILWAMVQQTRFSYYFAVNVMILSSWLVIKIADRAGLVHFKDVLLNLVSKSDLPEDESSGKSRAKSKKSEIQKVEYKKGVTGFGVLVVLVLSLVFLGVPTNGMYVCTYTLTDIYTSDTGGPNEQWISACTWLKENTPDPGLGYFDKYEKPIQDLDGDGIPDQPGGVGIEFFENKISVVPFDYPEESYGVMSWWDYGHWIEVIGERMACANPFQFGVGGRRGSIEDDMIPGSSPFFVAESEAEATEVLEAIHPDENKAGARYIVTDIEMASGMAKFFAMAAWTLDTEGYYVNVPTAAGTYNFIASERYYDSMVSRLHLFDTDGLEQYRMVFESKPGMSYENLNKELYNALHNGKIEIKDTGYVKVFEYVKGAKLKGTADPNSNVNLNLKVITNQGRTFDYTQKTKADASGNYEFRVPYSTTGEIIEGETVYLVKPTGPYTITQGDKTTTVVVNERDILNGNTISVTSL